ncbi:MAG: precorrin-6y C5,15-methyltransferase (decarboxylating) subunit CbiE [Alphaproteobacteria bacterium]|nr:precorrin-6y C5,15-methyltransferase (decarboxylating) subunit CbiE [Alphaproteobacteria bacterium]
MNPWLTIIGLNQKGIGTLSADAQHALHHAEIVVAAQKYHDYFPELKTERWIWRRPLKRTLDALEKVRGKKVVVLATGDPMWFGVGVSLSKRFLPHEMSIIPGISAFSLVCARLGWSISTTVCITMHGRPINQLVNFLAPHQRLILLSHDQTTPSKIANLLTERGYGSSKMIVFSDMNSLSEKYIEGLAKNNNFLDCSDFNTIAIECSEGEVNSLMPLTIGLPDDVFHHDGQLTKYKIRTLTLSALMPMPNQTLWDIGAGCGSISIEWARYHSTMKSYAIEKNEKRCQFIKENSDSFGLSNIDILSGTAPEILNNLEKPDAIFIGGGLLEKNMIDICWQALKKSGRLVINTVTIESEQEILKIYKNLGGKLSKISIEQPDLLGELTVWRKSMPVTQLTVIKT